VSLERELKGAGLGHAPYMMLSNGGIATVAAAKANPIADGGIGVLRAEFMPPPISGVRSAKRQSDCAGHRRGTTAKCALIEEGTVKISTDYSSSVRARVRGIRFRHRFRNRGDRNGRRSIAWVDAGVSSTSGRKAPERCPGPWHMDAEAARRQRLMPTCCWDELTQTASWVGSSSRLGWGVNGAVRGRWGASSGIRD